MGIRGTRTTDWGRSMLLTSMDPRRALAMALLSVAGGLAVAGTVVVRRATGSRGELPLHMVAVAPAIGLPLVDDGMAEVRVTNTGREQVTFTSPEETVGVYRVWLVDGKHNFAGADVVWYSTCGGGATPGRGIRTLESRAATVIEVPLARAAGYSAWPVGRYDLQVRYLADFDANFSIAGEHRRPDGRRWGTAVSAPFTLTVTEPTDPRTRQAYYLYRDRGASRDKLYENDARDPKALALALHAQRTGLDRYLWSRVAGHQRQRIKWELSLLEQGLLVNTFSVNNQEPFTSPEFRQYFRDWFEYLVPGPALDEVLPADELGLSPDDLALLAQLRDEPAARRNRLLLGLAYPQALTQSPDLVSLRYPDTPYGAALSGR